MQWLGWAGVGAGAPFAAWSRPQVLADQAVSPIQAQSIAAAMCMADLDRNGQPELVILRDVRDDQGGFLTNLQSMPIMRQGHFGSPSRVVQISPDPGDEQRLPAIAAVNTGLRGGPSLLMVRLGQSDGYIRFLHELNPRPGFSAKLPWASSLSGWPLSLSLATVDLGPAGFGLALFTFVDAFGTRGLYFQTAPLSEISNNQTPNWSQPIRIAQLDARIQAEPQIGSLQVSLMDLGGLMLFCTALWADGQTIHRAIFVGIDFNLTSGEASNWIDLSTASAVPVLSGSLLATAMTATDLGPSPLPSIFRGREGWVNLLHGVYGGMPQGTLPSRPPPRTRR
jgi:hypothetical protein